MFETTCAIQSFDGGQKIVVHRDLRDCLIHWADILSSCLNSAKTLGRSL